MFKIISRKKYKELVETQKLAEALQANIDVLRLINKKNGEEIDKLKARLNNFYGLNNEVNHHRIQVIRDRDLLAEEFRKAEDCIDDVYTLLNAISDKCNINALKAAKSRIGTYYTDPKIHCATNLAAQCMQVKIEDGKDEDTVTISCQADAPNDVQAETVRTK